MENYAVSKRANGTRWYVQSTRPLNGGYVGTDATDEASRAQRFSRGKAARLAALLNFQDTVRWNDWEVVQLR